MSVLRRRMKTAKSVLDKKQVQATATKSDKVLD